MSRNRPLVFASGWILLPLIFAGCGKNPQPGLEKRHADGGNGEVVYRAALGAEIKGLDPVQAGDTTSNRIIALIYETLLQYAYLERPYKLEPCLATAMPEVSGDGLTYTFTIRKGVRFQDDPCFTRTGGRGRELTAEDFIYQFKRLADARNQSTGWWIFDSRIVGLDAFRRASTRTSETDYDMPVEGLRSPDPHTLIIRLREPYPQLLYVLAMSYTSAVPKEAVDYYGRELINHPVGTGPYRLQEWVRRSRIVLTRNPDFREAFYPAAGEQQDALNGLLDDAGRSIPFIDRIERPIVIEDLPRWLSFMKGDTDISGIPKDSYAQAVTASKTLTEELRKKHVHLVKYASPSVFYIGFNMEDPVIGTNLPLRQAVSLGINQERRIALFANGRGIPAAGPIPPGFAGYREDKRNPNAGYNVKLARQKVREAEALHGGKLPVLRYDMGGTDTTVKQMGEFFVKEMRQIGIEVRVHYHSWPQFQKKIKTKSCQIFSLGWIADYPDAENFLQLFYGPNASPGPNNANYDNPEFNALYERIRVMPDSPARTALYQKMEDIIIHDCPWAYTSHPISFSLYYDWVKNYKPNPFGYGLAKYVKIDTALRHQLRNP